MLFEKKSSGKTLAISTAALSLASLGLVSLFVREGTYQAQNPSNLINLSRAEEERLWKVVSERNINGIEKYLPIEAHDSISREVLAGYKINVSDPSPISLRECHAILKSELKPSSDNLSFRAFAIGTVSAFLVSRKSDRELSAERAKLLTSLPDKISDHWKRRVTEDPESL